MSGFISHLRALLSDESVRWIEAMDEIFRELPFLLENRRPRVEEIRRSPIGQAGFSTWIDLLEAPPQAGGLGGNRHTWHAWRRAYAQVQRHPYLRDLGWTASKINTVTRELGGELPETREELERLLAERDRAREVEREKREMALRDQLAAQSLEIARLRAELAEARAAAAEASAARELVSSELERWRTWAAALPGWRRWLARLPE